MKMYLFPFSSFSSCLIFVLLLVLSTSRFNLEAQQTSPSATQQHLLSFDVGVSDAIAKSTLIMKGEFTDLGPRDFGGMGTFVFDEAKASITSILRGKAGATIDIRFRVRFESPMPGMTENLPSVGTPYIFFIRQEGRRNYIVKLLDATDANLAAVAALIH